MLVDVPVPTEVPITGNVVTGGSVGAKADAKMKGTTMENIGIIV